MRDHHAEQPDRDFYLGQLGRKVVIRVDLLKRIVADAADRLDVVGTRFAKSDAHRPALVRGLGLRNILRRGGRIKDDLKASG
jgi:hypothetical protein